MKRSIMQDQWYASANAKQWALGVLNEGNMLIDILKKQLEELDSPDGFRLSREEFDKLRILQSTHETFFVIAINKLTRWLKVIDDTQANRIVNEFEAKFPLYKNIRHMREHDVEYYFGKGNKQKEFIVEDRSKGFSSDGSSTIVLGNEYLIGGMLDVGKVIKYVSENIDAINGLENKFMQKIYESGELLERPDG